VAAGKLSSETERNRIRTLIMRVNNSGARRTARAFLRSPRKSAGRQYSGSIVSGNMSAVSSDGPALARYTQQTMQNDGLMDFAPPSFAVEARSARHLHHQGNSTYDQVFGDVKLGDGTRRTESRLAISGTASPPSARRCRRQSGNAKSSQHNYREKNPGKNKNTTAREKRERDVVRYRLGRETRRARDEPSENSAQDPALPSP